MNCYKNVNVEISMHSRMFFSLPDALLDKCKNRCVSGEAWRDSEFDIWTDHRRMIQM